MLQQARTENHERVGATLLWKALNKQKQAAVTQYNKENESYAAAAAAHEERPGGPLSVRSVNVSMPYVQSTAPAAAPAPEPVPPPVEIAQTVLLPAALLNGALEPQPPGLTSQAKVKLAAVRLRPISLSLCSLWFHRSCRG